MKGETEAESILRWIDERLKSREETLLDGQAPSYDEYRHLAGVIYGLRMVRNEISSRKAQYELD